MGLLPQLSSFEEQVADAFTAFRGSGVMISPLDAELVSDWSARRIPFEVVVRGLHRAAEKALWDAKPGEPALRSLRACRKDVEAEIRKYLRASAGAHLPESTATANVETTVDPVADGVKRLAKGLRKLSKTDARLEPLCGRLIEEGRVEGFDQRFPIQLLRALPFQERIRMLREARALMEGQVILSAHGRKLSRRFHRAAVLRRALDLQPFW